MVISKVANPQQDHCWKAQISGLSTCQEFLRRHGGMHKGGGWLVEGAAHL